MSEVKFSKRGPQSTVGAGVYVKQNDDEKKTVYTDLSGAILGNGEFVNPATKIRAGDMEPKKQNGGGITKLKQIYVEYPGGDVSSRVLVAKCILTPTVLKDSVNIKRNETTNDFSVPMVTYAHVGIPSAVYRRLEADSGIVSKTKPVEEEGYIWFSAKVRHSKPQDGSVPNMSDSKLALKVIDKDNQVVPHGNWKADAKSHSDNKVSMIGYGMFNVMGYCSSEGNGAESSKANEGMSLSDLASLSVSRGENMVKSDKFYMSFTLESFLKVDSIALLSPNVKEIQYDFLSTQGAKVNMDEIRKHAIADFDDSELVKQAREKLKLGSGNSHSQGKSNVAANMIAAQNHMTKGSGHKIDK